MPSVCFLIQVTSTLANGLLQDAVTFSGVVAVLHAVSLDICLY